jgi:Protein of unknown function (DUF992)
VGGLRAHDGILSGYYRAALAGTYAGLNGDVAIGLGLGANVLVDGSRRSIALQPLSVEGNVGVDVTLGVSRLRLRAAS